MLKIGGVWGRIAKHTDKRYLSIGLDAGFLKLVPQLKDCSLIAFYTKETDKKSDKAPDYELFLDVKKEKNKETYSVTGFDDAETDEVPFY